MRSPGWAAFTDNGSLFLRIISLYWSSAGCIGAACANSCAALIFR